MVPSPRHVINIHPSRWRNCFSRIGIEQCTRPTALARRVIRRVSVASAERVKTSLARRVLQFDEQSSIKRVLATATTPLLNRKIKYDTWWEADNICSQT